MEFTEGKFPQTSAQVKRQEGEKEGESKERDGDRKGGGVRNFGDTSRQ